MRADIVPAEAIERHSYLIRGHEVMLDFPLNRPEFENWRSHFVTSNPAAKMGLRRRPYAFTEQGVAMLSSVLRSERAVMVWVLGPDHGERRIASQAPQPNPRSSPGFYIVSRLR